MLAGGAGGMGRHSLTRRQKMSDILKVKMQGQW